MLAMNKQPLTLLPEQRYILNSYSKPVISFRTQLCAVLCACSWTLSGTENITEKSFSNKCPASFLLDNTFWCCNLCSLYCPYRFLLFNIMCHPTSSISSQCFCHLVLGISHKKYCKYYFYEKLCT